MTRGNAQVIQMAAKLYDARDSAKVLLAERYFPRVDQFQERIRNAMKASGREEMEVAIHMADALAKAGCGMDSIVMLAAAVEMIEPSERPQDRSSEEK